MRVKVQCIDETSLPVELRDGAPLYREWLAAWERLSPGVRHPLTHPAWMAPWALHAPFRDRQRCLLLFRDDAGGLLGVLPARLEHRAGALRLAHMAGIESASPPLPREALRSALEALFDADVLGSRPRSLHLHRVDEGDPLLHAGGPMTVARVGHRSVIPFSDLWPGVSERLSKNFRGNLRKARNRLAARGGSRVEVASDAAALTAALPRLIDVDARSWKREGGSVIEEDAGYRAFLTDAIARLGQTGAAQIHLLSLGGIDIAAQLTLLIDDVLFVVKVSYDQEHADLSPGNLLLEATLRDYCGEVRPREVNLVTGLEWHGNWRPEQRATFAVWLLPRDWRRIPATLFDVPGEENVKRMLAALHLDGPAQRLRRRLAG